MPFVTKYRYQRPSIESIPNDMHHNFHVANYGANGGVSLNPCL